MPSLLARKQDQFLAQEQPCDFSNPANNELTLQQVTIEELRQRCERYRELLKSLTPSQENSMIRASSFTVDSVRQLLDSSPGSAFIRVYYGIREDGQHVLFMGPVQDESASFATASESVTEEDEVWVENCCACPPRLNCPKDELLEWEP